MQKNWYSTFIIINETEYDISILSYSTETINDGSKILLAVKDTIIPVNNSYKAFIYDGELSYMSKDPVGIFMNPDSIKFIWGNENQTTYYPCQNNIDSCMETKSPFNISKYFEEECKRRHGCDYTYYITSDDLEIK